MVFFSPTLSIRSEAIRIGMGIGFLPTHVARLNGDLVQVHPPLEAWDIPVWLVTHVDLHRTPKVQAVLAELRRLASA